MLRRVELKQFVKKNTVSDLATLYLKEKDSLKTYEEYRVRVENYIVATFGNRAIKSIELNEIKDWLNTFSCETKTLKKYVSDFKMIYQIAIESGFIETNIFNKIRLPKHTKKDINIFKNDEISSILNEAKGSLRNFFGIAFMTGMRSGEIIALQHKDIDLDRDIISISKGISRGKLSTPKTAFSIRQVPILKDCKPFIKAQMQIALEHNSLFLFSKEDGSHFKNSNSLNPLRFLKENGYSHRVHDTRHTFITNMLNSGIIRITDLAQIVGHANTQMIMTTYAKYIKGEQLNIDRSIDIYGLQEVSENHIKKVGGTV